MKGIYSIEINKKYYIGKDVSIHNNKRLREHLALLNKNTHYNKYLQNAYNKYNKIYKYQILFADEDIDDDELCDIEIFYIEKFNTYGNGYNLTLGGEGGSGMVISEEERVNRSIRHSGENNPLSKLTNSQFYEIVCVLNLGLTNREISEMFNLHERYVSLLRHKKRFKKLWETIDGYNPVNSNGNAEKKDSKITESVFLEIVRMLEEGCTNAEIERTYGLSSGTVSRIRHKKLYKIWWERHFGGDQQKGSTTIETVLE
jgi:DNA-binding CsgD family transcriptional regulator